jgi:hypothetical protein
LRDCFNARTTLQSSEPQSDVVFGLELAGVFQPALGLALKAPNEFRLDASPPWLPIPGAPNPSLGPLGDGARLFRLSKP